MTRLSDRGCEGGATTIAFLAVIFSILGVMAASIVRMVTVTQVSRADHVSYQRAFGVNQAGIEYAVRRIYEGVSPAVAEPGISFGDGSFTIDRQGRTVTVTARAGASTVAHSVQSPTQADCTRIDVAGANLVSGGDRLTGIDFRKTCLEAVVLDQMVLSWTPLGGDDDDPETFDEVVVRGSTLYDEPDVPSGTLVELADFTMTTNGNYNLTRIEFGQGMSGKTFTMTMTFGDGSTRTATFTPSG